MSGTNVDAWVAALGLTAATLAALVLIDSGLRWWSAFKRLRDRRQADQADEK